MTAMTALTDLSETKGLNGRQWLVLYVYRHWIKGLTTGDPRHLEFAWSEIATASGPAPARRVLRALEALLGAFRDHARRRISYHPPCCGLLAADEREMLCLLASLQRGRREAAEASLRGMVLPTGQASVLNAADALAEALSAAGLDLEEGAGATLH